MKGEGGKEGSGVRRLRGEVGSTGQVAQSRGRAVPCGYCTGQGRGGQSTCIGLPERIVRGLAAATQVQKPEASARPDS